VKGNGYAGYGAACGCAWEGGWGLCEEELLVDVVLEADGDWSRRMRVTGFGVAASLWWSLFERELEVELEVERAARGRVLWRKGGRRG
jgi:hypothetical protein